MGAGKNLKSAAVDSVVLLILAAGFSTRLEPRTLNIPKQLLPVGKRVLIDFLFDSLAGVKKNFSKSILVTNGRFENDFRTWADNSSLCIKVISDKVMSKQEKLGAVGDFVFACEKENIKDDILVCVSDYVLCRYDFNVLIHLANKHKSSMTIAKEESDIEILKRGYCLELNDEMRVIKFMEKPSQPFSKLYGVPFYFIKEKDYKIIKGIPASQRDNSGQMIAELVQKSQVFADVYNGPIIHITTERDYQNLTLKIDKFFSKS